jgi:hypothetical protein
VSLPGEIWTGPLRRWRQHDSGRPEGGDDDQPMPAQKSDLFIGAMKPVKAGRAKGEMG